MRLRQARLRETTSTMETDQLYTRYQELQRYVGWTPADAARVAALAPLVEPHITAMVDDFYSEIDRHPSAQKVITGGTAQIERLKLTLCGWVRELLSGRYDRDYVTRRWRVGWRHVEIGLDQVYTNVAVARLRAGIVRAIETQWTGDAAELAASLRAMHQLVDLDLAIIEDAYQAEYLRRQQQLLLERQVLEVSTMEQQRIGRDLHDGLGQELTGIAFLTGVLRQRLKQKNLPEERDAAEIVTIVNQAIDHARALVRGLCPVDLEADGLVRALEELTSGVQATNRLRCRFESDRVIRIHQVNVASQLYYIASEAVHNAVKHARARNILVSLHRVNAGCLELRIEDDGIGISQPSETGRGLQIMPYRARMIGATLDIGKSATGGVCVRCVLKEEQAPPTSAAGKPSISLRKS